MEAYHSSNSEADDFTFAYSTDGTNFADLLTVTKTSDDDVLQSASIPGWVSGSVTVRVTDTDRIPGNGNRDSIFVDQLFIRSEGGSALPTVSITATDSQAAEPGTDPGEMTVSRSGATSSDLMVRYSVSGSATVGVDYQALPVTVIIPSGSAAVTLPVTPIDDTEQEVAETVIVTLDMDAAYAVGSPSSATVTIIDDDASNEDVYATSESTVYGSVVGSLVDAEASDGSYEAITEAMFAGGNKGRLEHRWTFQLTQPAAWVFHVEAFHDSAVEEMAFQYSTDGSSWIDLLTVVTNTDQGMTQSAALPAGLNGTVHVRAVDTSRSPHETNLDALFVDHMFMRS